MHIRNCSYNIQEAIKSTAAVSLKWLAIMRLAASKKACTKIDWFFCSDQRSPEQLRQHTFLSEHLHTT